MTKTLKVMENRYFDWLSDMVCKSRFAKGISYKKLLTRLHQTEFKYTIPKDQNRASDGIDLRYRFAITQERSYSPETIMDILDGPCSVLEMMVALSIRCEENIMDDPHVGDRTGQWFWGMVTSLGLGSMTDDRFNRLDVDDALARFLNHDYRPDGKGGLFTIRNCRRDLRKVEIWYQLCWYLDGIT